MLNITERNEVQRECRSGMLSIMSHVIYKNDIIFNVYESRKMRFIYYICLQGLLTVYSEICRLSKLAHVAIVTYTQSSSNVRSSPTRRQNFCQAFWLT